MGYYADIYIIKNSRSKELGLAFMDHFLPEREECATIYELPRFGMNTDLEFEKAEDLMTYLENNQNVEHCIYWRNKDEANPNRFGMLFYTPDGYMIFGISRYAGSFEDTKNEDECFRIMSEYLKTKEGYITYECPPEVTYAKFMNIAK